MTVKDNLRQALALFGSDGEQWGLPGAKQHCALTAVDFVGTDDEIVRSHTWPEVKTLFEKAIAAAE